VWQGLSSNMPELRLWWLLLPGIYISTCLHRQTLIDQYGHCGSTPAYCDTGCQQNFGMCHSVIAAGSRSSSSLTKASSVIGKPMSQQLNPASTFDKTPTATRLSLDARCGAHFGQQSCKGSRFGDCCSKRFYCGSTLGEQSDDHCCRHSLMTVDFCRPDTCQKGYGDCIIAPSPSAIIHSTRLSSNSLAAAPISNKFPSSQASKPTLSSPNSIATSSFATSLPSASTS
jgi:hypothetical protein